MKIKFDQFKFTSFKISGVPIHIKKLPWANNWVEMRVLVHAGALNDKEGKEGTAHFFEHLPFDGTEKYPSFEIMERIDRQLFMNTLNAYTSSNKTVYEGKVLKEKMQEGLDVLEDMVIRPLLLPSEVERERGVITQEIWSRFHNPKREKLIREIRKNIYGDHKYGRQMLAFGWSDTVAKIQKEDVLAFHKEHYHKDNIEIVLVGDITKEEARSACLKIVKNLPVVENKGSKVKTKTKNPLHEVAVEKIESPKNKQIKISAKEYFGFNEESTPRQTEIRATRIAEPINNPSIWGTLNSLLRQLIFEDLRGKLGGTYSPHVRLDKNLGHHAWSVSVGVKPELTKQAEEIIKNNILKIAIADKKDKDLKNRFEETQKMRLENILTLESSAGEIADFAIDDLANFEKIKNVNEGLKERLAVTFDDVCTLAKKELLPEKLFWFIEEP